MPPGPSFYASIPMTATTIRTRELPSSTPPCSSVRPPLIFGFVRSPPPLHLRASAAISPPPSHSTFSSSVPVPCHSYGSFASERRSGCDYVNIDGNDSENGMRNYDWENDDSFHGDDGGSGSGNDGDETCCANDYETSFANDGARASSPSQKAASCATVQ